MSSKNIISAGKTPQALVQNTMKTFIDSASVNRVFGPPTQNGDVTVIPAAEVMAGLGFGFGGDEDGEGGGGGGGHTFARPVAVISITKTAVYVEPIVDATKVALAGITLLGFVVATLKSFKQKPERP
jgi:uncharacterized spore protein YtfJ